MASLLAILTDIFSRLLMPQVAFMIDPVTLSSSAYLKFDTWTGLSFIFVPSLSREMVFSISIQLASLLPGGLQFTGPPAIFTLARG
jgi:hypothetical protein